MTADVQRDLGRHDARLDAMENDLQEMKAQMAEMTRQIAKTNEILSTARGGWKTLMLIGGGIAAGMQFLVWLGEKFVLFFRH